MNSVHKQVRNQLVQPSAKRTWFQVRNEVRDEVWNLVWFQVMSPVRYVQVRNIVLEIV